MKFSKNNKLIYTSINGKEENAVIIQTKGDFKEGYINSDFAKGNFDYVIEVKRNGEIKQIFCKEKELK